MPVFDAKGVSIFYGSFRAVTDVSLIIYQNEITAFIGSSGSGKSTVLRAFNRMNDLVPTARMEGQIDYRGVSLYGPGVSPVAVRRRIGMVFQKPNPFRSRFMRTSPTGRASTASGRRANWTRSSSAPCGRPRCGTR